MYLLSFRHESFMINLADSITGLRSILCVFTNQFFGIRLFERLIYSPPEPSSLRFFLVRST